MCMTAADAHLCDTYLYLGEAMRQGRLVHVMAYQNTAESLSGKPNAMILPVPSKKPLGPENLIDTRAFPDFMKDIAAATAPSVQSRGLMAASMDRSKGAAQVIDVGNYAVILPTSIEQVPAALLRVPPQKRPTGSDRVLSAFPKLYADWPILMACWSGAIKAEPLLVWYEPLDPSVLFAPSLDAHDGGPPRSVPVEADVQLAFGSTINPRGLRDVRYRDRIPEDVRSLLPTRAIGAKIHQRLGNGDFWYKTGDLAYPVDGQQTVRKWPAPGSVEVPLRLNS